MFLAEVILTSPQCVPSGNLQQRILNFMEAFLSSASYKSIRDWEIKRGYVWSIFLPYVKLMYFPEPAQARSDVMNQLHTLSLQTALLSLQNMLGRDIHRDNLFKESLEDYITCMPAYLPPGPLMDQAKELVKVTGSGKWQLQPPKLINLLKAKFAKEHFGLMQVVNMTSREILSDLS